MATKEELEKELNQLSEDLRTSRSNLRSTEKSLEIERERVKQLKHSIASLEQENSRMKGYIDRVAQEDNAKLVAENGIQERDGFHPKPFSVPEADRIFTDLYDDAGYGRKDSKRWYEV